ncbi:MAG: phosphatidylglycerophosphatase A [Thermodesulfobacteriota bacterium]
MPEPETNRKENTSARGDRIRVVVASLGGLGLLPGIPGTFGALFGLGLHLLAALFLSGWALRVALLLFLAGLAWMNYALTPWATAYWKSEDPSQFVADEAAGYLMAAAAAPDGPLFIVALGSFVLFRVLDVIKIPPAWQIDRRMHGAWGIFLDDLVSGLYAAGVLHLLFALGVLGR